MDEPPNAFQTLDAAGRPVLVFTVRLIAEVDNADEMMGHEAAGITSRGIFRGSRNRR